ncbi:MAG: sugar transporter ATP-binding protein [Frankiales bacterium]|nr:sugar transporter ATP-binding protein [Frankiales bacterium]
MGDRVAVLKDGILQQVDRPRAMYDRPANMFVAGFIGSPAMNLFTLPVGADGLPHLGTYAVPVARDAIGRLTTAGSVAVGVRPEDLHVVDSGTGIAATVELVEELGSDAFVHASVQQGENPRDAVMLVARVNPKNPPDKGAKVWLAPSDPQLVHVFDPGNGARLSA